MLPCLEVAAGGLQMTSGKSPPALSGPSSCCQAEAVFVLCCLKIICNYKRDEITIHSMFQESFSSGISL